MKNLVSVLIIVIALTLVFVLADAAFPTSGERAARDARAAARAQSAQAWAEQADERAAALTLALWGLAVVTLGTVAGVGAAVVRLAFIRSAALHVDRDTALYPAVLQAGQWRVLNEPGAQTMAALPARPSAAVARALLGEKTTTGRGDAPRIIDATAVDVTPYTPQFDLKRAPHFLFAGQTGRGKTTAMWQVAGAIDSRHDIAWTIAEPGGANWKEQATATEIGSIAQAVARIHGEMMRRLALLQTSTANHVSDLPDPLPYVGFVVEEAESVYGDLSLSSRPQAQQMAVQLRQLAAMGRKAGVVLLLGTQTALRSIFDATVLENVGTVFLFGGDAHLAERFRVSRDVRLPALGTGQAYCTREGRIVQFARAQQAPRLRLALPAPKADTRSDTWADTQPVITPVTPDTGTSWADISPPDVTPVTPMPTDPAAPLSDAQRLAVIDAYRRAGGSLRATQRALFPGQQEGGHWFYWIRAIVNAEHAALTTPHPLTISRSKNHDPQTPRTPPDPGPDF